MFLEVLVFREKPEKIPYIFTTGFQLDFPDLIIWRTSFHYLMNSHPFLQSINFFNQGYFVIKFAHLVIEKLALSYYIIKEIRKDREYIY
jgi:hypothetical protein